MTGVKPGYTECTFQLILLTTKQIEDMLTLLRLSAEKRFAEKIKSCSFYSWLA
jgi:hypothetical protein